MIEPEKFYFVDRFVELTRDPGRLRGVVETPPYIPFLETHFPGLQVFPASLLFEIVAQHAGALGIYLHDFANLTVVASASKMGASRMVPLGSDLEVKVSILHLGDGFTRAKSTLKSNGETSFKAELTMRHIPWPTEATRKLITGELKQRLAQMEGA